MTKYFQLLTAVLSLLFFQCEKAIDLPPPETEEPVFDLGLTIGGQELNFAGGKNGYRMFTSFEQDSLGIHTFTGEFKKENCNTDCFPVLKIEIRDFQINNSGNVDIETALSLPLYDYFQAGAPYFDTAYVTQFTENVQSNNGNIDSFLWDFGDSNTSMEANPEHEYENASFNTVYPVSLEVQMSNGLHAKNTQELSFDPSFIPCTVGINATVQGNFINLSAIASGTPPFSYNWYPDDSTGGDNIFIPLNDSLLQNICIDVTDASGRRAQWCGNVFPYGQSQFCNAYFNYDANVISTPITPMQFSSVLISFTDDQGILYRSDIAEQAYSSFKILDFEEFELNENGKKTKKIHIQFSCVLQTQNGNLLEINSAEGVIGVAYP